VPISFFFLPFSDVVQQGRLVKFSESQHILSSVQHGLVEGIQFRFSLVEGKKVKKKKKHWLVEKNGNNGEAGTT
jgi:hypothetical protein